MSHYHISCDYIIYKTPDNILYDSYIMYKCGRSLLYKNTVLGARKKVTFYFFINYNTIIKYLRRPARSTSAQ